MIEEFAAAIQPHAMVESWRFMGIPTLRRQACAVAVRPQAAPRASASVMTSSALAQRSDAELVEACAQRDARAWRELVHRYRRLVYGIPLSLGLQPADADEVFQQTFAELVRSLPRLRDGSRIEAWLVTTSRRAALRLKRDQRRRVR